MSFRVTGYPWGAAVSTVTANGQQQGIVQNVAADGSALTSVTFPQAYATAVTSLVLTIIQISGPGTFEMTVQASAVTLTGFQIYAAGAPLETSCSVSWVATGY